MEVVYAVTFRPQSRADQSAQLVVGTERERFVVPLVAKGAAPALDLPDVIDFGRDAVTHVTTSRTVLARNVGTAAATFVLTPSQHFSVTPQGATLAPGEVLQLRVGFTPPSAGPFEGELEVRFASTDASGAKPPTVVYTTLRGVGADVEVGLSASSVALLPTYVTKTSQKTFRILNRSGEAVRFAIKAHATRDEEALATTTRLAAIGAVATATTGGIECGDSSMISCADGAEQRLGQDHSDDEDTILASRPAALVQTIKDQTREASC
jgi:hydrocephalus-inducing protein